MLWIVGLSASGLWKWEYWERQTGSLLGSREGRGEAVSQEHTEAAALPITRFAFVLGLV